MNARDRAVVALKNSRAAGPTATWRMDFEAMDPVARRLARYVLALIQVEPKAFKRSFDRGGSLNTAWNLITPLLDTDAINDEYCEESDDDDEYSEDPTRQWRQTFLLSPPPQVLARLALADGHAPTHRCVDLIAQALGLSAVEVCLLDFAEKRNFCADFVDLLRVTSATDGLTNTQRLAAILNQPTRAIREGLAGKSILRKDELVGRASNRFVDLEDFLTAGSGFVDILMAEPETVQELTELLIETMPPSPRQLADFPHLQAASDRITAALGQAARQGSLGVNALLYGPPGVGKTELAGAIADAAGLVAFRVRSADEDGDGLSRDGRLSAYRLAQRILGHRRDAIIIFDEIEDVFADQGSGLVALFGRSARGEQKGATNRTLEENPVPAIWITNDVSVMDPAFLRRFLLPVELTQPPRTVRRKMVDHHLGDSDLPPDLLDALAADDKLAPAQFGAARQLLSLLGGQERTDQQSIAVQDGVAAIRRLLHGAGQPSRRSAVMDFDLAFLNVAGGIAPSAMASALGRRGRGTLCFYGMPGTGKTEFAHVLADSLDRELVVKRASDLVSKYVGETEGNIAAMFRTIDPDRSVIFLDEIDSFLRDRERAERSWEVSQVNELLQHMETFPGIFIAATNLVADLDQAAMRRFDFKLHFRPLRVPQRLALFAREVFGDAGRVSDIPGAISQRLGVLEMLTAGDFANVCRQRELLGEDLTPQDFLRRLAQECQWKSATGPAR